MRRSGDSWHWPWGGRDVLVAFSNRKGIIDMQTAGWGGMHGQDGETVRKDSNGKRKQAEGNPKAHPGEEHAFPGVCGGHRLLSFFCGAAGLFGGLSFILPGDCSMGRALCCRGQERRHNRSRTVDTENEPEQRPASTQMPHVDRGPSRSTCAATVVRMC